MLKKKSVETKNLILKTSFELFSKRGYDKTPIALILEKTGLSKGGFYQHFKSKEEIINLIARMHVDTVVAIIEKIASESDKTALQKFNLLIEQVQVFRNHNRDQLYKVYEGYLKSKNLHLKAKIETYTIERAMPPYVEIVKQGIAEGVFYTASPELAVETIIRTAPEIRLKMARLFLAKDANENYKA
jgi:AcrR family transcriptional regulator